MKSKYQRIYIIIITAVIYTMLFNMKLIMSDLGQFVDVVQSCKEFIHRYIASILFSFIFFFAFSFNKILYSIVILITFICSTLGAYFVYHYQVRINYYTVVSFLYANKEECLHFINIHFLAYVLLAVIVALYAIALFIKYDNCEDAYPKLSFVSMFFVIFAITLGGMDITEHYLPYNYLEGMYRILINNDSNRKINNNVEDLSLEQELQNLNVVIIIGESARYDHFHINGYNRETTPNLDKMSNLVSFSKMQACNNFTFHAVPCLLYLNYSEYKPNTIFGPSIIQILNQLNFVSSWIATQGSNSSHEISFNNIANAAKYKTLIHYYIDKNDVYDLEIIPFLEQKLLQSGNQLIILHTRGSHFHYEWRYTPEFKKFNPICKRKFFNWQIEHCTDNEIINSYDNTILYTDQFIYEVIKKMHDKNAIVVYVSDHGESLGENGVYLHGTKLTPEQLHIPLFIWASDSFINSNPKKFEALRYNRNKNISYMNIFHTILDCIGVKSSIIDPSMSLCHIK
ncbi:MAG: phosphoethanolamine transferase [Rickettsiales endosymbiont of Dermacentor nuttalli]